MESNAAVIARLRKMINDVALVDGNSIFTDEELEMLLNESDSIYRAAAEAWVIKASLLQGEIESYSAGNEKYDMTSLKDRLDHALRMAEMYEDKVEAAVELPQGSIMLKFSSPDVM